MLAVFIWFIGEDMTFVGRKYDISDARELIDVYKDLLIQQVTRMEVVNSRFNFQNID